MSLLCTQNDALKRPSSRGVSACRDTWEEASKRIGRDLRLDVLSRCLSANEATEACTDDSYIDNKADNAPPHGSLQSLQQIARCFGEVTSVLMRANARGHDGVLARAVNGGRSRGLNGVAED